MSVFDAKSYIQFLNDELEQRINQNSSYSLRAFARDLTLSPGNLSEILKGKRPLSVKNAVKISAKLGLNKLESKVFCELPQINQTELIVERDSKELGLEFFKAIESWYHFAILNLLESVPNPGTVKKIATRLGINFIEAKLALDRLENLGLIRYDGEKWVCSEERVDTPTDIPSLSIRKYHHQMLQKASAALGEQEPKEREISGVGMAFDPKNIKAIKKDISDFQDAMIEKYSGVGKPEEVYQLEMAFFKLSKTGDKNE